MKLVETLRPYRELSGEHDLYLEFTDEELAETAVVSPEETAEEEVNEDEEKTVFYEEEE